MVFTPTTKENLQDAVDRWTTGNKEGLGNISKWDTSNITDMSGLFFNKTNFNDDISGWNVSKVTDMEYMFGSAQEFNQPIGNWDVSNVTNMIEMFDDSGYTHTKPSEAPPKPPPCMSQEEYKKCIAKGDTKPIDVISQEELEIKDAVKLPGQPNTCYDRRELKKWFKNNKTNPLSREPVTQDWINKNMGDQDCEPQTEGGKGKRKTKKSTKKTKKQTKKKAPKRKKRT